MDFIVSCRTAVCGHSFCQECITESLLRKRECPCCREDIRKYQLQTSDLIDKAVTLLADSKGEAAKLADRLSKHQEWLLKHKVPPEVKAGTKLDVLDTEYIWCKAMVELKI